MSPWSHYRHGCDPPASEYFPLSSTLANCFLRYLPQFSACPAHLRIAFPLVINFICKKFHLKKLLHFARSLIFGGFLFGLILPVLSAWGRLAPYDGIGGTGGVPFRLDCGEYGILVGLNGQSGAVVDRISGLCVNVDPVSGIWIGGVYETNPAGGNGGGRFHKICPVGQALTGILGTSTLFQGIDVVNSLEIDCTKLKITDNTNFPAIQGWREIGVQGDPDAYKIPQLQDLCYSPAKATGHFERAWSRIGIALEGRAGLFVDHIHLVCGSLPKEKRGYRVQFTTSPKGSVPEGTPLNISWRASGSKPELTPPLQYSWELHGLTQAPLGGSLTRRTHVQNPCSYAQQPCTNSWFGASSGSKIIFHSLPPAKYELRVKVRPTVPSTVESKANLSFEIRSNQLAEMKLNPSTIQSGGISTATISLEGPAPPRGKKIYLSSSSPELIPVPEFLTITGGAKSATLKFQSDSQRRGGQATIRASTEKSVTAAVSKITQTEILRRGISETIDKKESISQEPIGEHDLQLRVPESSEFFLAEQPLEDPRNSAASFSEDTQAKETLLNGSFEENQRTGGGGAITERGIGIFKKRFPASPGQTLISPVTPVIPAPLPSPKISGAQVFQPQSKLTDVVRQQPGLLTLPSASKEAVLTIQPSSIQTAPLAVPKVPPLQK